MMPYLVSILAFVFSISAASSQSLLTDVAYGSGPAQKLDVYPSATPNSPLIVLIHGGAWVGGSKNDLTELASFLQDAGYTVSSIDYRLSWQATFPANIQDVACALTHLRSNAAAYNADTSRVALLGYSAGGHLAMLQATAGKKYQACEPEVDLRLDAMIGVCGIYDFKYRAIGEPDRLLQMLGDSALYWDEADPMQHLDGVGTTKFLLLNAAIDHIVPPQNTYDLYDSLRTRGVLVEQRTFYAKDHLDILSTVSPNDSVISTITDYLARLWPQSKVTLDTVTYDVDINFRGRTIQLYSRHDGKIVIYNLLGQVVTTIEVAAGISEHYLWNVPYGCYFISVLTNDRRTTARVILD
jgi:acetyl esterase/lipase